MHAYYLLFCIKIEKQNGKSKWMENSLARHKKSPEFYQGLW
jgi:hypothetical protein